MENLSKEYQKKLDFSSVKKDENNLENPHINLYFFI